MKNSDGMFHNIPSLFSHASLPTFGAYEQSVKLTIVLSTSSALLVVMTISNDVCA